MTISWHHTIHVLACSVSGWCAIQYALVLQSVSWQISPEALSACKRRFRSETGKSGCMCVQEHAWMLWSVCMWTYVVCVCPSSLGFAWQNGSWCLPDEIRNRLESEPHFPDSLIFSLIHLRYAQTLPGGYKGHLPQTDPPDIWPKIKRGGVLLKLLYMLWSDWMFCDLNLIWAEGLVESVFCCSNCQQNFRRRVLNQFNVSGVLTLNYYIMKR